MKYSAIYTLIQTLNHEELESVGEALAKFAGEWPRSLRMERESAAVLHLEKQTLMYDFTYFCWDRGHRVKVEAALVWFHVEPLIEAGRRAMEVVGRDRMLAIASRLQKSCKPYGLVTPDEAVEDVIGWLEHIHRLAHLLRYVVHEGEECPGIQPREREWALQEIDKIFPAAAALTEATEPAMSS